MNTSPTIGIMQGRLSPPVDGRVQVFPSDSWALEFARAAEAGLCCIEWIYDEETEAHNPMRTDEGLAEMRQLIADTGVRVVSVCADYYMTRHLLNADAEVQDLNVEHLQWLIRQAGRLNIRYMVLPFVDASSLRTAQARRMIVSVLKSAAGVAAGQNVELHVESDLEAPELVGLLEQVNHPLVRANYDIGNSASLGNDPNVELPLLTPWLGSVHVKDRILGGTTVPLGTGSADLAACFDWIRRARFPGPYILQVARDTQGNEVESAIRNRRFVEQYLT